MALDFNRTYMRHFRIAGKGLSPYTHIELSADNLTAVRQGTLISCICPSLTQGNSLKCNTVYLFNLICI